MNILLTCANGLSTSLVAQKLEKAAKDIGVEAKAWAVDMEAVGQEVESKQIDVILVAPQAEFAKPQIQKVAETRNIPVLSINRLEYGRMACDKIMSRIMETIG